jgi:hypothetical protein
VTQCQAIAASCSSQPSRPHRLLRPPVGRQGGPTKEKNGRRCNRNSAMRAVASVALRYLTRYSPGKRATVILSPYRLRDQDNAVRKIPGVRVASVLRARATLRNRDQQARQAEGGGSHDRHRATHNGPGKKTELVILEPATATATILGLLYSRIQINSENTHRKSKLSA